MVPLRRRSQEAQYNGVLNVVCGLMLAALLACTTSPAIPSSSPPPSPFANVAGDYRLTIEIDEKCAQIPQPLRVRTYDVVLEDKGWHFMPIRMADERFSQLGGDIWPPGSDSQYRVRWNNFDIGGCDYPEPTGSTQLYLCGDGAGTLSESTISGVIGGSAFLGGTGPEAYCTGASHRFALVRQVR
jgi:hypothetical protein